MLSGRNLSSEKNKLEIARDCTIYHEEKGVKHVCEKCSNREFCRSMNQYSLFLLEDQY